jgi:hypothetical protein
MNKETTYTVVYRIYNSIEVVHFETFSQYVNWQSFLLELNEWHKQFSDYIAFEVMSIREDK